MGDPEKSKLLTTLLIVAHGYFRDGKIVEAPKAQKAARSVPQTILLMLLAGAASLNPKRRKGRLPLRGNLVPVSDAGSKESEYVSPLSFWSIAKLTFIVYTGPEWRRALYYMLSYFTSNNVQASLSPVQTHCCLVVS
jgi:hypothetical protein